MCGISGGNSGGVAQSYLTMGMATCTNTVEVTRSKAVVQSGKKAASPLGIFIQIIREKGIREVYKGFNAVALR